MISTKELLYSKLTSSSELQTVLGAAGKIYNFYPETVTVFPLVAFQDENQSDFEYADNRPHGSSVRVKIDIFTKTGTGLPTTWDIGKIVYDILSGEDFDCGTNGEVADPTDGVRHRVMRFSREFIS
jgi:hypothetical protein